VPHRVDKVDGVFKAELHEVQIQQLEYTRQHESQSLNEEKKILREIRQLESSREQVKANSALLSQYTSSGAEREQISTQLKVRASSSSLYFSQVLFLGFPPFSRAVCVLLGPLQDVSTFRCETEEQVHTCEDERTELCVFN
jgi:hypothetical protein